MVPSFVDVAGEDASSPRYRLLKALLTDGPLSRAQLARTTALAPSTVTAVVRSLTDEQVLIATGPAELGDGRRSGPRGTALALSPSLLATVGVDFGFQHVRVLISDLHANVLTLEHTELPARYDRQEGIESAAQLVRKAIAAAGLAREAIIGAAVALPGPIDTEKQQVVDSDIQPGWGGTSASDFAEAFALPAFIENDANLAALGEHVWGAGRGQRTTITVKLHSGIGAGVIVNGQLVSGAHGGAGEIGHITIDPRGPLCRCGKRGCLDTFAAIPAILDAMAAKHPDLRVAELIDMLDRGDPGAQRVVADAANLVGHVVASACLLLAPDSVIVVGAMARAGDAVIDPLREAIHRQAIPGIGQLPEITRGLLGDRHTALGGAALVLRENGWLPTAPSRTEPLTGHSVGPDIGRAPKAGTPGRSPVNPIRASERTSSQR